MTVDRGLLEHLFERVDIVHHFGCTPERAAEIQREVHEFCNRNIIDVNFADRTWQRRATL